MAWRDLLGNQFTLEMAQIDVDAEFKRPGWSETFFEVATILSRRSTCPRGQTGAVITSADRRILATGYNGAPSGLPHCTEVGCLMDDAGHCIRAVHAEMNAIIQAARYGTTIKGGTLYTTTRPCIRCASMVVQSGIICVYYTNPYATDDLREVNEIFRAANVVFREVAL